MYLLTKTSCVLDVDRLKKQILVSIHQGIYAFTEDNDGRHNLNYVNCFS